MGRNADAPGVDESCAYFLVAHGSPDPRPGAAIARLAAAVGAGFAAAAGGPGALVGHGALECVPVPLAEQLSFFGRRAAAAGRSRVRVVPLFLQAGVHARQDVPAAVAAAAARSPVELQLLAPVGLHAAFRGAAIARWVAAIRAMEGAGEQESVPLMVLAHGSRRGGGNGPVEAIAAQVGAIAAYWTVEPGWQRQAVALGDGGCDRAIVLPYFLFAGSLTDAIAQALADWNRSGQGPHLQLGRAIAATEDGIDAVAQAIRAMVQPSPNPEI